MILDKRLQIIVNSAREKKAEEVVVIDMRQGNGITDWFVICSGSSQKRIQAIADNIIEGMREKEKVRVWHIEGYNEAKWILLDYSDIVVHIFYPETRRFYDLEHLWGDMPRQMVSAEG